METQNEHKTKPAIRLLDTSALTTSLVDEMLRSDKDVVSELYIDVFFPITVTTVRNHIRKKKGQ